MVYLQNRIVSSLALSLKAHFQATMTFNLRLTAWSGERISTLETHNRKPPLQMRRGRDESEVTDLTPTLH